MVGSRMLKSLYRREPLVSVVVTIGVVDVAIGGLSAHWSLLAVGLGTVGVALLLRWRLLQRQSEMLEQRAPVHILPPARPNLPTLTLSKKQPPGRI